MGLSLTVLGCGGTYAGPGNACSGYLVQVTEEHQRRLKLRHWLLLLVRTMLVLALVLAAAGPSAPLGEAVSHAPSALVLVVDNSPSSAAVVAGTPRLTELRAAAP